MAEISNDNLCSDMVGGGTSVCERSGDHLLGSIRSQKWMGSILGKLCKLCRFVLRDLIGIGTEEVGAVTRADA